MTAIRINLSKDDAKTYRLVLSSSGISNHTTKDKTGWKIWVADGDGEKAKTAIEQYLEENEGSGDDVEHSHYPYQRTYTGIWVAILLLAVYIAIDRSRQNIYFVNTYGSAAFQILHGELYRSVTSLMLHGGTLHIAGNMAGIAIFGSAVCSVMGLGVGWLLILGSGIVGNLANALLYESGHVSIGASTSIFGAIGILSAYQFFKHLRQTGIKFQAFLPLGGGLALLGILGASETTDLMAHLFGFLAGITLGSIYTLVVSRTLSYKYQAGALLAVCLILAAAWLKLF